jgi:hypothetical protein
MSEIPIRTMLLLLLTLAFFVILTLLGIHPVSVIEIENATETEMQQFKEQLIFTTVTLAFLASALFGILVALWRSNRKSEVLKN